MTRNDIKRIANHISKVIEYLIPHDSNRPKNKFGTNREFWIRLARAKNDRYGSRAKLKQWHMDLTEAQTQRFMINKVKAPLPNTSIKTPTLNEWYEYLKKLGYKQIGQQHKDGSVTTAIDILENTAKNGVKFGIGNCAERSALGFCLFKLYPIEGLPHLPKIDRPIRVEQMELDDDEGDHVFLVLNRHRDSDIRRISTWGRNTFIFDPWFQESFFLRQITNKDPSPCFERIEQYQDAIVSQVGDSHFIGDALSERWKKQSEKKKREHNFYLWKPAYTKENAIDKANEKIPWLKPGSISK